MLRDTLARHQKRCCDASAPSSLRNAQASSDTEPQVQNDVHSQRPADPETRSSLDLQEMLSASPVHVQPNIIETEVEHVIIPDPEPPAHDHPRPSVEGMPRLMPDYIPYATLRGDLVNEQSFEFEIGDDLVALMTDDFDWGAAYTDLADDLPCHNDSMARAGDQTQKVTYAPVSQAAKISAEGTLPTRWQAVSGNEIIVQNDVRAEVDEGYRYTLHRRLHTTDLDQTLPSAQFLNLCVRTYFARFHNVFPVIHRPSFRPSSANSTLLLSICSIGSLLTGSTEALSRGVKIFEKLNKVILATWDDIITYSTEEAVPMVQAALLGQTFGLLSGNPRHLSIVDAFHGTVISWARRSKMFQARHEAQDYNSLHPDNCQNAWRKWSRTEEIIRLVAALHVHDAEISSILHHSPLLRHAVPGSGKPALDQVFDAKNSREWCAHMSTLHLQTVDTGDCTVQSASTLVHSVSTLQSYSFSEYADLERILATISEKRHSDGLDDITRSKLTDVLLDFHYQHLVVRSMTVDTYGLHILWHFCFMSLVTDFDLLEQAIGRNGQQIDTAEREKVQIWAASLYASRAKIHMQQILMRLEAFPIGLEPAIHIPRVVLAVAMSWYCCHHYMSLDQDPTLKDLAFPEQTSIGLASDAYLHRSATSALEVKDVLYRLADILRRLGHWECARKFAFIVAEFATH